MHIHGVEKWQHGVTLDMRTTMGAVDDRNRSIIEQMTANEQCSLRFICSSFPGVSGM